MLIIKEKFMNFFEKRAEIKKAKADCLYYKNQCAQALPQVNEKIAEIQALANQAQADEFLAQADSIIEQAVKLKDIKKQMDALAPVLKQLKSDKQYETYSELSNKKFSLEQEKASATKPVSVKEQYEERESYRVPSMMGGLLRHTTQHRTVTKERTVIKDVPDENLIKPIDAKLQLVQQQMQALPNYAFYAKHDKIKGDLQMLGLEYALYRTRIINSYPDMQKAEAMQHKTRIDKLNRDIQSKEHYFARDYDRAKNYTTALGKSHNTLIKHKQDKFLEKNRSTFKWLNHFEPFKPMDTSVFVQKANDLDMVDRLSQELKQELALKTEQSKSKTAKKEITAEQ